jgi:hypothetical protein
VDFSRNLLIEIGRIPVVKEKKNDERILYLAAVA